MASNLTQRLAFAVIAIPLALGIVWYGGWPLVGLVAAAGVLGARELYQFARRQGIEPVAPVGLLSAGLLPVMVYLQLTVVHEVGRGSWLVGGLWVIALLTAVLFTRSSAERPLAAAGVTLLGVVYPAGLAAFLIPIRHLVFPTRSWAGAWLVFTPLVLTWICDTAAMFGGKAIGGPRLWPAISPGKTWAGAVAGVIAAVLAMPLLNVLLLDRLDISLPLWQSVVFALVLSVVGQVGDLAESLFKREVGLKDSSGLIPGHGGVLDRLDSLYFVVPVTAALYRA